MQPIKEWKGLNALDIFQGNLIRLQTTWKGCKILLEGFNPFGYMLSKSWKASNYLEMLQDILGRYLTNRNCSNIFLGRILRLWKGTKEILEGMQSVEMASSKFMEGFKRFGMVTE